MPLNSAPHIAGVPDGKESVWTVYHISLFLRIVQSAKHGTIGHIVDLLFFLDKPRVLGPVPPKSNEVTVSQRIQIHPHLPVPFPLDSWGKD